MLRVFTYIFLSSAKHVDDANAEVIVIITTVTSTIIKIIISDLVLTSSVLALRLGKCPFQGKLTD
jgi:hypothetical protein